MNTPVLHLDLDDIGRKLWERALVEGRVPNLNTLLSRFARSYPKFWARDSCSPFRAGVMTGLDPHRKRNLTGAIIRHDDDFSLPVTRNWMLPMGMPGWKTHRGKWHLGNHVLHPINCGFDEWSGSLSNLGAGSDGGYQNWEVSGVDAIGNSYQEWTTQHATEWTFDAVMEDLVAGVEFIHASFNAVHKPLEAPPGYTKKTDKDETRLDMLEHMEVFLAMLIVTALRRGYVIFLVMDNGTAGDGKGSLTEDGINTPLYVLGTNVRLGTSQELIQCTDLFRTYRTLRGAPPLRVVPDSHDMTWDLFPGAHRLTERAVSTCCDFKPNGVVPKIEDMRRAVKDEQDWKLVAYGDGTEELYWLEDDPDEENNRILSEPGIADYLRPHLPTP